MEAATNPNNTNLLPNSLRLHIYKTTLLFILKSTDNSLENNIDTEYIKKIKLQLNEYFSGNRQKFDIKINPKGTEFQKKVWCELREIPFGKVKSYS